MKDVANILGPNSLEVGQPNIISDVRTPKTVNEKKGKTIDFALSFIA